MHNNKELKQYLNKLIKVGKKSDLQNVLRIYKKEFMDVYKAGYTLTEIHKIVEQFNMKCSYQTFRVAFSPIKKEILSEKNVKKSENISEKNIIKNENILSDNEQYNNYIADENNANNINNKLNLYD